MFESLRWLSQKQNTAPGSLVYAGKKREFTPSISLLAYNGQGILNDQEILPQTVHIEPTATTWVRCTGVHSATVIQTLGTVAAIPNIALEDIMNTGQRPKLHWFETGTFLTLRDIGFDSAKGRIHQQQISLFWNGHTVFLFQEIETNLFANIVNRIQTGRGQIRNAGTEYLVVAILDAIIDRAVSTLHHMSEQGQHLEEKLLEEQKEEYLHALYQLRRETVIIQNSLLPMRNVLRALCEEHCTEAAPPTVEYLHHVNEHAAQATDLVHALADIMSSMIELQISLSSLKTNGIMRILALVSTIFIPLTFIAGIYGMNFDFMPELRWHYGYFTALGLMGVTAVTMLLLFLRNRWF